MATAPSGKPKRQSSKTTQGSELYKRAEALTKKIKSHQAKLRQEQ